MKNNQVEDSIYKSEIFKVKPSFRAFSNFDGKEYDGSKRSFRIYDFHGLGGSWSEIAVLAGS